MCCFIPEKQVVLHTVDIKHAMQFYLTDSQGLCTCRYQPPEFQEGVLGPKGKVTQSHCKLQAWQEALYTRCFGNPRTNPLKKLVEHIRRHSHKVDEFSLIVTTIWLDECLCRGNEPLSYCGRTNRLNCVQWTNPLRMGCPLTYVAIYCACTKLSTYWANNNVRESTSTNLKRWANEHQRMPAYVYECQNISVR